ncbi:MAG: hypothetical protein KGI73_01305 [Patescibacteria group bacterium]|nr:hypothetical protein [Patescibacteria group bacterium]
MKPRFERTARHAVLFKFGHGRYLDLWSLLHVLAGFTLGLAALFFNFSWWLGLSVILLILFAYELFEASVGIAEDIENSLADVVCGLLGALLAYGFAQSLAPMLLPVFGVSVGLAFVILFIGWDAYLKRRVARSRKRRQKTGFGPAAARSLILFFGLALATIPLPLLLGENASLGVLWFSVIGLATLYALFRA